MKENKNKGFTVVELMVVVAIMGVVLVVLGVSISVVFSNKAKAASKEIYNMLGVSQNIGMSKDNIYFYISRDTDGEYEVGVAQKSGAAIKKIQSEKISSKVSVVVSTSELANGKGYLISLNRSTGGFQKTFTYDGGSMGGEVSKVTSFRIENGSTSYTIQLSYTNGKFFYV